MAEEIKSRDSAGMGLANSTKETETHKKIEIRRSSFYKDFECLADHCPQTCCRGWRIPIDDAHILRYNKEKGLIGLRIRLAKAFTDPVSFNWTSGRCPFLNYRKLCTIQRRLGEEAIPRTCRYYPRIRVNEGLFAEEHLDLSCIYAAKLFLKEKALHLVTEEDFCEYPRWGNNDDYAFLRELDASRNGLISFFEKTKSPEDLDLRFQAAAKFAKKAQDACIRGEDPFSEDSFSLEENRNLHTAQQDMKQNICDSVQGRLQEAYAQLTCEEHRKPLLFPMSIDILNGVINTQLYDLGIRHRAPFLYKLIRRYFRGFDKLTPVQGQEKLEKLLADFFAANPKFIDTCRKYVIYDFYRYYLEIFEDYSFLRKIRLCALHTSLFLLFEALWWERNGKLSMDDAARVLSVYEKRARHTLTMENGIYKIIEEGM